MAHIRLVILAVCVVLRIQSVIGLCEDGWIQNGLYCYFFSERNATYEAAQAVCEESFSTLIYIDDDGENVFAFNHGALLTGESYWIGYEKVFGTIWRWTSTGMAGAYRKWDIGEPDGEGSCARLTPYIQGVWRDWECHRELFYICKKFADCGPPEELPDSSYVLIPDVGEITPTMVFPVGAYVTYTCNEGMEFGDEAVEKSAMCSIGGAWLPDIINTEVCEPKQCGAPPLYNDENMISNGTDQTRAFGTVVSYKCESGYWFNQFAKNVTKHLTCTESKEWLGDEGVVSCSKTYCVRPVTANAYANTPLNSFLTVATYTCIPGYEYEDNTTVKTFECGPEGWIPDPMQCKVITCDPWEVKNAEPSTDSLNVFTEVIWKCKSGMRYPDTTTRKAMKCLLDQTWDRKIRDECERKRCEGPPPNATETYTHDWNNTNGEVYRYGDVVNYTCIPEWYFSDGLPTRKAVCNEDGEWSPKTITDCIGEIIEVKQGVTHKPVEIEGAATFGTLAYVILGTLMGVIIMLDAFTIGKHLGRLKENIFGPEKPADEEPLDESETTPASDVV